MFKQYQYYQTNKTILSNHHPYSSFSSSSSGSFSFSIITSDNMCEIQPCSYLISKQRFESIYTHCKVKPSSHNRWALTGVPHGNLSLAHTEVFTVASHPRILSSLTCARLLAGCFQHAHSPCPQKHSTSIQ